MMPPWPTGSGLRISQRKTRDSPSFCWVPKLASRSHCAVSGMYSKRVVRLSEIVTWSTLWSPTLSNRIVKSTSSPG